MTDVYQTSHIKRARATKAEVNDRREALWRIVHEMRPMTVRQVFYQATVRGLVEKTEGGYAKVQTDLAVMRKSGIPFSDHWCQRRTSCSEMSFVCRRSLRKREDSRRRPDRNARYSSDHSGNGA